MPCGEYFTSYESRMGLFRWRIQRVVLVLGLPIPFLLPLVTGGGTLSLLSQIYVFAIAVLGLNVILGYAGQIVLAQGAFMAIGAYTAYRILSMGIGLIPAILAGGVVAAAVSVVFGLPAFRVKGFYIAISTLALQFITEWFFNNPRAEFIFGASQQTLPGDISLLIGVVEIGRNVTFPGGLMISGDEFTYLFTLVSMLTFALLSLNLSRTGIGRTFRAVHENDLAAAVLGVNVFKNKLLAFAIGGFMIGVSGGLYGFWLEFISPDFFTINLTLEHYVMLLFGGIGHVWGALLGTGIVRLLRDFLRESISAIDPTATALIPVVFGIIIIVVLAVEPKGVLAALGQIKSYLRKWPYAY